MSSHRRSRQPPPQCGSASNSAISAADIGPPWSSRLRIEAGESCVPVARARPRRDTASPRRAAGPARRPRAGSAARGSGSRPPRARCRRRARRRPRAVVDEVPVVVQERSGDELAARRRRLGRERPSGACARDRVTGSPRYVAPPVPGTREDLVDHGGHALASRSRTASVLSSAVAVGVAALQPPVAAARENPVRPWRTRRLSKTSTSPGSSRNDDLRARGSRAARAARSTPRTRRRPRTASRRERPSSGC